METSSRDAVVLLQTACADAAEAARIADALVTERLAACVQTWPVESRFVGAGKAEVAAEVLVQAKTVHALADAATARIVALHGYDVPEVVVLPVVGGSAAYRDWVRAQTERR